MAQLEGIENTKPCGAIVKYNPCTKYARGSSCLHFNGSKKCDRPPLTCKMPEYDKWYREVVNGKRKCFYPKKIRLLETPGVPMFLFHIHYHAIMGEVQIVRTTVENRRHFYWFHEFLSYLHPVQLELLKTDARLPKLAKIGHWLCVYISQGTIEEIRSLSKLSERKRKKLGEDLQEVIKKLRKLAFFYRHDRSSFEIYMKNECEKLKRDYKISEQILIETQKYFSKSVQKKLTFRRPLDETFYTSLYLAFRMLKIPKLPNDIAKMSGVSPTKIGKLYRLFVRELNLTVPFLAPEQLANFYSKRLNVSKKTIRRTFSLIQEARKRKIFLGEAPSSIAAAAMFVACQNEGEKIRQKQVAEIFGVSTVTIRNCSKKLKALQRKPCSTAISI